MYACEVYFNVDSTQGVEAQTLASVYQALDINHEIVPVLNKIDLPTDIEKTKTNRINWYWSIFRKNGKIRKMLEQIIKVLPSQRALKMKF